MTRKRRRLWIVLACGVGLGSAAALSLSAFSSNLVFFMAPAQVAAQPPHPGQMFRLGGLVQDGSLHKGSAGAQVTADFAITDGKSAVPVTFTGVLPDLFREGQGVVALGHMTTGGTFQATEVLAKHDETYMPKDVEEALKKSGQWNPKAGPPPPASTWNTLASTKQGG